MVVQLNSLKAPVGKSIDQVTKMWLSHRCETNKHGSSDFDFLLARSISNCIMNTTKEESELVQAQNGNIEYNFLVYYCDSLLLYCCSMIA